MKSLFKTVSLVLFFTILTRAAGFLLRIFLSREIGAEQLGIYQISLSIFVVLATAVSSGLPLVISRLTAKYIATNDKQSQKRMLGCALIIAGTGAIIITLLCFIFQNAFAFVFADDRSLLVFIVMLPALIFGAIDGVFKGSQWGKNNYLYVCIVDFFEQISRIILCVLLLNVLFITLDGAVSAGIALCISCMLSMIFSIILFFSKKGKIGKPVNHYAELIKGTAPITGMRLASSLMTPIISIILPLRLMSAGFTNSQAMSLMGVAFGMTLPLLFIPSTLVGALTMALVPDLACAKAKNENKYIDNRISSSIVFTLMGCIIFIPLFMGAGELIGQFLFANMQSGVLLSQSAWLMLPLGMVNLTAGILNSLGLEFKSLKNYVVGTILMLACIIFLPKFIGLQSVILGMGLCTGLASILNIKMLIKQKIITAKLFKPFVLMIVFCLPVVAIVSFLSGILSHFMPLFFNIIISCGLGAICFVLLCVIFNCVNLQTFIIRVKSFKFLKKKKIKVS